MLKLKKKILFFCSDGGSLVNFRGNLIRKFIASNYDVIANTPNISQKNLAILHSWGVECIDTSFNRKSLSIFVLISEIFSLVKIIKIHRPNIIFSYTQKPVLIGALAAFFCRVPEIISLITGTGHLFDNYDWKSRIRKFSGLFALRIALKISSKVIFQNNDNLNLFTRNKLVNKDKTYVINGSGVDINAFPFQPFKNTKTFLCLARLLTSKGLREYAESAKQILSKYPEYTFLLGGPADEHEDSIPLEEIENVWPKKFGVHYIGNVSNPATMLGDCDAYILLSYNEGTPRSVLEAMSVGRPIITTDAPGCRETVVHGLNGFLVEPRNINSAVKYIEKLIHSNMETMGIESRKMCEVKYDVEKVNENIFDILEIYE